MSSHLQIILNEYILSTFPQSTVYVIYLVLNSHLYMLKFEYTFNQTGIYPLKANLGIHRQYCVHTWGTYHGAVTRIRTKGHVLKFNISFVTYDMISVSIIWRPYFSEFLCVPKTTEINCRT